MQEGIKKVR